MNRLPSLNIVGAGKAATTLARLWAEAGTFQIAGVCNRSSQSSVDAVKFIGAGTAVQNVVDLQPCDVTLVGTPDIHIQATARTLSTIKARSVVFHLSGALPSTILNGCCPQPVFVASAHPVRSFANPEQVYRSFTGSACALEGDVVAVELLHQCFSAIGATPFHIKPAAKTTYHAANVLVCNNMVALLESGFRCFEHAGIDRETAKYMMEPLVRETINNVFDLGPTAALTGPVSRGDRETVRAHLKDLNDLAPELAQIYTHLGLMALQLARQQDRAPQQALDDISRQFAEASKQCVA